ncbi:MAG: Hsp20/alpha crystallin family protein [Proteobacteria bacterium]|nr:Hsp20/alpha crystallin family protein [Pseudomonadota bacterium]
MPALIIWKNQEIDRMKRDMDRLLARLWDDFSISLFPRTIRETPFLELSETEDALVVKAEIPGVGPEDLDISLTDDRLTIKGEIKQDMVDGGENYVRREKHYGLFSRTIQLPCKVLIDNVKASYRNGVLSVVMPKCKPEATREIKIRVR